MGQNVHGSKAGALLDGRDLTRYTTDFNFATDIDMAEQTCLMADGGAKEYLYGNAGSSAGLDGRLAKSKVALERELDTIRGKEEGAKLFLQAPAGFAPGAPAVIFQTLKEKLSIKGGMTNVNGTGMSFVADGVARIASMLLAPRVPKGADVKRNEIQTLSFDGADPNQFFGLRASGTTQLWQFQLGSYATDAALGTAVKTGIEGLAAYAGRTATVTVLTPRSGTAALSLALKVEFDGATNVAQLEAISGAVDSFVVTGGDSGNYTANGGANFALGVTQAAFQANQRNLGGERQDVVCKGASVANSGPGQVDSFSGSGPALSINHPGKTAVAVDWTVADPKAKFQADYRVSDAAAPNPQRAGAVVGGTWTKAGIGSDQTNAGVGNAVGVLRAGEDPLELFDNDTSNTPGWEIGSYAGWDFGAGQTRTINSARLFGNYGGGAPYPIGAFVIEASATGSFTGEESTIFAYDGANLPMGSWSQYFSFAPTTARAFRVRKTKAGTSVISEIEFLNGTPASITDGTITHDATKGSLGNAIFTGAGYVGTTQAPQPNGSANFKSYYPLNRAPAAPTKTGVGAIHTRLIAKGDAPASLTGATVQEGGAFSGLNLITAPTNFPAVKTADVATPSGATIDLHATFVSSGALSVPVVVEHSANGTTGWATLATFVTINDATNRAQLAQRIVLPAGTAVQPWLRVRVPTLTGSVALGVALARKPS